MLVLTQNLQEFFSFVGDFVYASADSFYITVWKQIVVELFSDCV